MAKDVTTFLSWQQSQNLKKDIKLSESNYILNTFDRIGILKYEKIWSRIDSEV